MTIITIYMSIISGKWIEHQKELKKDTSWEEDILPGLNFTTKQLFWISWGQLWCDKYRDESLENLLKTNDHCPGEFRIKGPLSNMDDFARDFNCPKGSKMNPEKKCLVW